MALRPFEESVTLRPFQASDIDLMCDYWYRSSPEFLASMKVVPGKMIPEDEMRRRQQALLSSAMPDESRTGATLTIEYEGEPVGVHVIAELVYGEQGVFHAHIWRPELRRVGLASHTYPRACRYFMDRFRLQRIVFKTPVANPGPNRVKQKMGLMPTGEVELVAPFLEEGTMAYVYELTPGQLQRILETGHA